MQACACSHTHLYDLKLIWFSIKISENKNNIQLESSSMTQFYAKASQESCVWVTTGETQIGETQQRPRQELD